MDVLVLGGTHHVGRSVVEEALARGDAVTTLTRGVSGPPAAGARSLLADRTEPATVAAAIAEGSWDVVVDTWSGAPSAVRDTAALLGDRVAHYVYISSRSVYRWPIPVGLGEDGPVVDGDPTSTDATSYAAVKRGGELATLDAFGSRALVARAGLILGPYERVGRLPWWLRRMERGGRVLAPGPVDRPLQYIDGRDLARWLLACAEEGVGGVYNTVSAPGHTTMGALLEAVQAATGGDAALTWVAPQVVLGAGIAAWTELPIWVPPDGDLAGLHSGDVSAALARGLQCRPVTDTVADTWAWLQREGDPDSLSSGTIGLDPARESALLATIE
jgi:nucleoside-diphosphate-sugar epimerase